MAAALLPDLLWDLVEPFFPILARRPQGGRPRVSDRACLTGIVFVLRSGIPWQMLPQELAPIARSPLGVVASAAALAAEPGPGVDRPCGPAEDLLHLRSDL